MKRDAEVIIVGAGLAGLNAAKVLSAAGKTVVLLEARDRLGGRVQTVHDVTTTYPIELGPEWVSTTGSVARLLQHVNATVVRTGGAHFVRKDGSLLARENFDETLEIMERIGALIEDGNDLTLSDALVRTCPEEEFAESCAALAGYVTGFHAADPALVSVRWLLQVEENEPANASEGHTLAGLDHAVDVLRAQLGENVTIEMNAVVRSVEWSENSVVVRVDHGDTTKEFRASKLLCTLPLAVLKLEPGELGAVQFTPPLTEKRAPLALLETGPVVKLVLVFGDAFWTRIAGLEQVSFIQQPGLPFPTWWTTHPIDAPVLTGWVAGPLVANLGGLRGEALLPMALDSLAPILGVPVEQLRHQLRSWHTHDWTNDPFARGGYSYVLSGGTEAYRELARPISNTLFFAGEATCGEGHNATMEGALKSGERAATELLAGWQ